MCNEVLFGFVHLDLVTCLGVKDDDVDVETEKVEKKKTGKKKAVAKEDKEEERINYGPKDLREGEHVFGIAHIYASFNDTFVV